MLEESSRIQALSRKSHEQFSKKCQQNSPKGKKQIFNQIVYGKYYDFMCFSHSLAAQNGVYFFF
jgi:hypothetical protein